MKWYAIHAKYWNFFQHCRSLSAVIIYAIHGYVHKVNSIMMLMLKCIPLVFAKLPHWGIWLVKHNSNMEKALNASPYN